MMWKNTIFVAYLNTLVMKRIIDLGIIFFGILLISFALMSCTKQCECQKVTHYANHSTQESYTQTVDGETSCSSLNGEFFTEDAYGNPISVDVVNCREAM